MKQPVTSAPRARLWADLSILAVIGVLLFAAIGAGGMALYQQYYSPSAFVSRYLDLLATGRAADALQLPGVAIDRTALETVGIEETASEALLRRDALAPLSDVEVLSEKTVDGITTVAVSYTAGTYEGETTFAVQQDGWVGVTPNWRFATTPLAAVELTVLGADQFIINGFEIDRRQVVPAGPEATPADAVPLLVFTPGLYSVTVDTPVATAQGVSILADAPLTSTPVEVQSEPTEEFVSVVQERVEEFLMQCTEQQVLQPTACPFGLQVLNRLATLPEWSIVQQPKVTVKPDGAHWQIPPTDAVAHIEVDIQSLFDGSIEHVAEDVPFQVNGTITILPDGSASIRVGSPADED